MDQAGASSRAAADRRTAPTPTTNNVDLWRTVLVTAAVAVLEVLGAW